MLNILHKGMAGFSAKTILLHFSIYLKKAPNILLKLTIALLVSFKN